MLLQIPQVLSPEQVTRCLGALEKAEWVDGRITAGHQSAKTKHNRQVRENAPVARKLGDLILAALETNALFLSAALPLKVFPPLFNRYEGGQSFGDHIDNAVRQVTGTPHRVRTDLSATLFLSAPDSYDGGELVVDDTYGAQSSVKLPAGDMALYPAKSLHRVLPVSRGTRIAAFFWIQSMVRDDGQRRLLFELDLVNQRLNRAMPDGDPALVQLMGIYHNLLRMWADV